MYRELRPDLIAHTVEGLHTGLVRHFPESGLRGVAIEILEVARLLEERAHWIRPSLALMLRGSVALVVVGMLGALG